MPVQQCGNRPSCVALVPMGTRFCARCVAAHGVRGDADARRTSRPWKKWYDTKAWREARLAHFAANPFCVDPYGLHGMKLVLATVLDHIVAHKGDARLFWDGVNWQGLCSTCHGKKSVGEGGFGHR